MNDSRPEEQPTSNDAEEPTTPLWAPGGPQKQAADETPTADRPDAQPEAAEVADQATPADQPADQPTEQPSAQTTEQPVAAGPAGPPPMPPPTMASAAFGPAPQPKKRGAGFAAGVVAAAVIAGGAAGVGGAAIFNESGNSTGNGPVVTSDVVDASAPASTVEKVADKVLPSVVKIDVAGNEEAGSGSGVIISSDGEIVTNEHVVSLAKDGGEVRVDFSDGTSADAEVIGTDPLTDTALIKANDVSGLTPATIGKSSNLNVGAGVVAVGSPFGLDSTVTSGIISALDRPVNVGADESGNATVYPAIQTDAAINPGNSGGALTDMNGNVIGINASIKTSTAGAEAGNIGLGFAIPIDEVMPIVDQMRDGETPTHARMGVTVTDNMAADNPNKEAAEGALVDQVGKDSAAGQTGIEAGSVITHVDDNKITGSDSLVAVVRSYRPGDEVSVTWVTKDGDEKTGDLTLGSD